MEKAGDRERIAFGAVVFWFVVLVLSYLKHIKHTNKHGSIINHDLSLVLSCLKQHIKHTNKYGGNHKS